MIIFHLTYFDVPRRRVTECFGVARSTFYRWLEAIDGSRKGLRQAWNRTAADIAALVWDVVRANAHWGRVRIANQLRLLGVFVSPSTVRNILSRPKPSSPAAKPDVDAKPPAESRKPRPSQPPIPTTSGPWTSPRCLLLGPMASLHHRRDRPLLPQGRVCPPVGQPKRAVHHGGSGDGFPDLRATEASHLRPRQWLRQRRDDGLSRGRSASSSDLGPSASMAASPSPNGSTAR